MQSTLTIHTAKRAARLLVKSTGFRRKQLFDASRDEKSGIQGAKEHRLKLTSDLNAAIRNADTTIAETERKATDYAAAARILRSGDRNAQPNSPIARLACRLGGSDAVLADLCGDIAQRADAACEVAQDKLDKADSDLLATAYCAKYLSILAANQFKTTRKAVRDSHSVYCHFRKAADK